jgi:hypothetical protein
MRPSWRAGVVPPSAVAVVPSAVRSGSPGSKPLAGTHVRAAGFQNRWLAVVWMTWMPWAVLTRRS